MRVHCSILVTACPWKICPYNENMQRPFVLQTYLFLLRAVRTASESTEISVQLGPVRTGTAFFKNTHLFFMSVRPSVKAVSAAGTTRSRRVDVLKSHVYFHISVAMCKCLPPQLIIKSRRRFYISTRIVDPKLFSHEVLVMCLGLNDV